jgi:hemolysin III
MDDLHDPHEEFASAATHALGVLLSIGGSAALVAFATMRGSATQIVAAGVFAFGLVLLYLASTLYHSASDALTKARLRVFDHCAIYILIAATYTPFTLVGLRDGWGWSLFAVVWTLAAAGVVFKLFYTGRFKRTSTALYIAMGWIVLVAIVPLVRAVPLSTLAWLLAGGVAYTAGTVFYHNDRVRYSHAIWHCFVLAGSTFHFVAVWRQVVPASTM